MECSSWWSIKWKKLTCRNGGAGAGWPVWKLKNTHTRTELGPKEVKSARALDAQWMIIKNKQKEPKDGDSFGIFQHCDRWEITSLWHL